MIGEAAAADRSSRWRPTGAVLAVIAAAAATLLMLPAALAYDPESWLVWGRELAHGDLDVTAGPAVKPLPMAWNGAAVALLGDAAAWQLWAVVARAGLLAAVWLAAVAVAQGGGSRGWQVVGAGAVAATPTLIAGALTGAAEPLCAAGLLGAVVLVARGRLLAAISLLACVAMLRPEALVAIAAVAGFGAVRAPERRLAALAAAVLAAVAVPLVWVALQLAGGGDLSGGVDAATALRPGQPGLTDRPWLATLAAAARTLPWLVLVAAAAAALASRTPLRSPEGSGAAAATSWWAGALGLLWIATVALMSELGFSGEPRYLAPGVALIAVAGVTALARRAVGPVAATGAAVAALVAVALPLYAAVVDQRALRASQQDLAALLLQPAVRASAEQCADLAVPRFMRPPVAWRAGRPISSIRSPNLTGAACSLRRAAPPDGRLRASGVGVSVRRGQWTWQLAAVGNGKR